MLQFRNVDASPSDDITTWPFEALATAIDRGLVADWQPIFAEIRRAPWGAVTRRAEHHLDHRDADGTTAIFRLAIGRARHDAEQAERAEVARRVRRSIERSGLTSAEFARAVGTSASRLSMRSQVRAEKRLVFRMPWGGGEGGIRTHGSLHYTRFPGVPDRPLQHLSPDERPC